MSVVTDVIVLMPVDEDEVGFAVRQRNAFPRHPLNLVPRDVRSGSKVAQYEMFAGAFQAFPTEEFLRWCARYEWKTYEDAQVLIKEESWARFRMLELTALSPQTDVEDFIRGNYFPENVE